MLLSRTARPFQAALVRLERLFFFAGSIRSFEPEKKTGKKHEALHSYIRGGGLSVLRDACAELF